MNERLSIEIKFKQTSLITMYEWNDIYNGGYRKCSFLVDSFEISWKFQ
jgi:hypothetical protein